MSKQTTEIVTGEDMQESLITLAESSISKIEEVVTLLETDSVQGLSPDAAAKALDKYGPNELAEEKKEAIFIKLLN